MISVMEKKTPQKKIIFGMLEQGKTRKQIDEESGSTKSTIEYYTRMWNRLQAGEDALPKKKSTKSKFVIPEEDENPFPQAPGYPDAFEDEEKVIVESVVVEVKPSAPAVNKTPTPAYKWVKPRRDVAPFFREKQAR